MFLLSALSALAAPPLRSVWVDAASIPPGVARGEGERVRDGRLQVEVLAEPGATVLGEERVPVAAALGAFEAGQARLADLAAQAPRGGLARWGVSVEGRSIDGLWLGQAPSTEAPVYRIVGAHHGDEPASADLALAIAGALVEGDGVDPAITAILDRATVWIAPVVNPDGFVAGTRTNANGVDLNRNYDYEWDPVALRPGSAPFSEPETQAVRAQAAFARPIAGLTLHAGAANIGWPWNYTTDDPAEAPLFEALASAYAAECTAPGFWTTQGADWYLTTGDLDDWSYGRHGTLDFTVEVGAFDEDADDVIAWHLAPALAFLTAEPAVEGVVVDAESGAPVEASLWVDGGQPFVSGPATGRFATLEAGAVLHVEAPGYAAADVPIGEGALTVELDRENLAFGRPDGVTIFDASWRSLLRPGAGPGDPGWYSVVDTDGAVWPRAVVFEQELGATMSSWQPDGDVLRVLGAGFAEGARGFVLAGDERVPVEVEVTVLDEGELAVAIPDVPDPADLVLWVSGSVLAVNDLRQAGSRDPECGCAGTGRPGAGSIGLLLLVAVLRRSRS